MINEKQEILDMFQNFRASILEKLFIKVIE